MQHQQPILTKYIFLLLFTLTIFLPTLLASIIIQFPNNNILIPNAYNNISFELSFLPNPNSTITFSFPSPTSLYFYNPIPFPTPHLCYSNDGDIIGSITISNSEILSQFTIQIAPSIHQTSISTLSPISCINIPILTDLEQGTSNTPLLTNISYNIIYQPSPNTDPLPPPQQTQATTQINIGYHQPQFESLFAQHQKQLQFNSFTFKFITNTYSLYTLRFYNDTTQKYQYISPLTPSNDKYLSCFDQIPSFSELETLNDPQLSSFPIYQSSPFVSIEEISSFQSTTKSTLGMSFSTFWPDLNTTPQTSLHSDFSTVIWLNSNYLSPNKLFPFFNTTLSNPPTTSYCTIPFQHTLPSHVELCIFNSISCQKIDLGSFSDLHVESPHQQPLPHQYPLSRYLPSFLITDTTSNNDSITTPLLSTTTIHQYGQFSTSTATIFGSKLIHSIPTSPYIPVGTPINQDIIHDNDYDNVQIKYLTNLFQYRPLPQFSTLIHSQSQHPTRNILDTTFPIHSHFNTQHQHRPTNTTLYTSTIPFYHPCFNITLTVRYLQQLIDDITPPSQSGSTSTLLQLSKLLRCPFGGQWLSIHQYPMWLKSTLMQNNVVFNIYEYRDQLHIPISSPSQQQEQPYQYQFNTINDFDTNLNFYTLLHTDTISTSSNSNSNTNQHFSHNNNNSTNSVMNTLNNPPSTPPLLIHQVLDLIICINPLITTSSSTTIITISIPLTHSFSNPNFIYSITTINPLWSIATIDDHQLFVSNITITIDSTSIQNIYYQQIPISITYYPQLLNPTLFPSLLSIFINNEPVKFQQTSHLNEKSQLLPQLPQFPLQHSILPYITSNTQVFYPNMTYYDLYSIQRHYTTSFQPIPNVKFTINLNSTQPLTSLAIVFKTSHIGIDYIPEMCQLDVNGILSRATVIPCTKSALFSIKDTNKCDGIIFLKDAMFYMNGNNNQQQQIYLFQNRIQLTCTLPFPHYFIDYTSSPFTSSTPTGDSNNNNNNNDLFQFSNQHNGLVYIWLMDLKTTTIQQITQFPLLSPVLFTASSYNTTHFFPITTDTNNTNTNGDGTNEITSYMINSVNSDIHNEYMSSLSTLLSNISTMKISIPHLSQQSQQFQSLQTNPTESNRYTSFTVPELFELVQNDRLPSNFTNVQHFGTHFHHLEFIIQRDQTDQSNQSAQSKYYINTQQQSQILSTNIAIDILRDYFISINTIRNTTLDSQNIPLPPFLFTKRIVEPIQIPSNIPDDEDTWFFVYFQHQSIQQSNLREFYNQTYSIGQNYNSYHNEQYSVLQIGIYTTSNPYIINDPTTSTPIIIPTTSIISYLRSIGYYIINQGIHIEELHEPKLPICDFSSIFTLPSTTPPPPTSTSPFNYTPTTLPIIYEHDINDYNIVLPQYLDNDQVNRFCGHHCQIDCFEYQSCTYSSQCGNGLFCDSIQGLQTVLIQFGMNFDDNIQFYGNITNINNTTRNVLQTGLTSMYGYTTGICRSIQSLFNPNDSASPLINNQYKLQSQHQSQSTSPFSSTQTGNTNTNITNNNLSYIPTTPNPIYLQQSQFFNPLTIITDFQWRCQTHSTSTLQFCDEPDCGTICGTCINIFTHVHCIDQITNQIVPDSYCLSLQHLQPKPSLILKTYKDCCPSNSLLYGRFCDQKPILNNFQVVRRTFPQVMVNMVYNPIPDDELIPINVQTQHDIQSSTYSPSISNSTHHSHPFTPTQINNQDISIQLDQFPILNPNFNYIITTQNISIPTSTTTYSTISLHPYDQLTLQWEYEGGPLAQIAIFLIIGDAYPQHLGIFKASDQTATIQLNIASGKVAQAYLQGVLIPFHGSNEENNEDGSNHGDNPNKEGEDTTNNENNINQSQIIGNNIIFSISTQSFGIVPLCMNSGFDLCGENGTCDQLTGQCKCIAGHSGQFCTISDCIRLQCNQLTTLACETSGVTFPPRIDELAVSQGLFILNNTATGYSAEEIKQDNLLQHLVEKYNQTVIHAYCRCHNGWSGWQCREQIGCIASPVTYENVESLYSINVTMNNVDNTNINDAIIQPIETTDIMNETKSTQFETQLQQSIQQQQQQSTQQQQQQQQSSSTIFTSTAQCENGVKTYSTTNDICIQTGCSCDTNWSGDLCSTCNLQCNNLNSFIDPLLTYNSSLSQPIRGTSDKWCNKCNCLEGFGGSQCQCRIVYAPLIFSQVLSFFPYSDQFIPRIIFNPTTITPQQMETYTTSLAQYNTFEKDFLIELGHVLNIPKELLFISQSMVFEQSTYWNIFQNVQEHKLEPIPFEMLNNINSNKNNKNGSNHKENVNNEQNAHFNSKLSKEHQFHHLQYNPDQLSWDLSFNIQTVTSQSLLLIVGIYTNCHDLPNPTPTPISSSLYMKPSTSINFQSQSSTIKTQQSTTHHNDDQQPPVLSPPLTLTSNIPPQEDDIFETNYLTQNYTLPINDVYNRWSLFETMINAQIMSQTTPPTPSEAQSNQNTSTSSISATSTKSSSTRSPLQFMNKPIIKPLSDPSTTTTNSTHPISNQMISTFFNSSVTTSLGQILGILPMYDPNCITSSTTKFYTKPLTTSPTTTSTQSSSMFYFTADGDQDVIQEDIHIPHLYCPNGLPYLTTKSNSFTIQFNFVFFLLLFIIMML